MRHTQRVKRTMDSRRKLYVRLGVVSAVVVLVAALVLIPQARGKGWRFMQKDGAHTAFDIPKLEGITVDGNADDWGDRGFCGGLVGVRNGSLISPNDFGVSYRVGWTTDGLLLLMDVTAKSFSEARSNNYLERDAVEIFLADSVGGGRLLQAVVSPGVSPQRSELAYTVIDWYPGWRVLFGEDAARVKIARTAVSGGYTMETMLPWDMVGLSPALGRTVGFQLSVGTWDETAGLGRATWYPARPGGNTQRLQPLRLAERAGGYRPSVAVGTEVVDQSQLRWNFACEKRYSGRSISVRRGPRVMAESVLKADDQIASATCLAPRVEYAEPEGPAEVIVGNPGGSHFACPVWVDALPALGFARPVRSPDGEVCLPGLHAYEGLRGGMLRELLGCAKYVGYWQSDAWLAGATGFAFAINVPSDLCPSGPSAWADADLLPLAANAGLFIDVKTFNSFKDLLDIPRKQKVMFQWVQAAINDGRPTVGTGMATPETYLVCGYDGQGNYLYIEPGDSAPRKRNHAELQSAFFMFPRLAPAIDDRAAVANALVTALALADGRKFNDKCCGLRAYDNWIAGLTTVAANAANSGHGAAYNAAVWAGHRQFAVPFLKEARKRLNAPNLNRLFDAAIKQYDIVAENLAEVSRLFPLSGDRQAMERRFTDDGVRGQARGALQAAKAAETEGVKALGALLDAIGRPDTSRPADLAARATQAYEQICAEMRSTDADGSAGYVGDLDGYLTELLISAKLNGWEDLSYHTLCAVSGSSGLFAYEPRSFMGKYANRSIGMDKRIAEATGYTIEWVKWKDIEDAWRILKESIDSGRPVMGEYYEMCSWVGYREDSVKEKRWVYMLPGPGPGEAGWKTWAEFEDWFKRYGGFYEAWGRLGARVKPASEADVAKRVIQDLVSWSKAPYPGAPPADRDKNLYGLAGIRAYASDILDVSGKDVEYWDSPWAGCHAIQPQRAFRYATVVYLESLVSRTVLDPAATKEVAAAAAEYRQAWQQWMIWERQLGRTSTGIEVWKDAEHRRTGGQALLEAAKHEERALVHLRAVVVQRS